VCCESHFGKLKSNAAKCWISNSCVTLGYRLWRNNAVTPTGRPWWPFALFALRSSSPQRRQRQVGLVVYLTQNLSSRGRSLPIIFARIVRPIIALQIVADSFHTKKLISRISSIEVQFQAVHGRFCFLEPPLGRLGIRTVRCSSWDHWKARSGLPN